MGRLAEETRVGGIVRVCRSSSRRNFGRSVERVTRQELGQEWLKRKEGWCAHAALHAPRVQPRALRLEHDFRAACREKIVHGSAGRKLLSFCFSGFSGSLVIM